MRGVSADRLACGAGPAPAVVPCKHGTGTLKGTVRGHVTDPLPFLAGRGLDRTEKFRPRRRFKPSGFRLRFQVLVPGSTVPERKTAELERRKVPVSLRRDYGRPDCAKRRSGPSFIPPDEKNSSRR